MGNSNEEFRVNILGRTVPKTLEQLGSTVLDTVFQKHLRCNRGKSTMIFHPDKIQFTEQGYREFLYFNEIVHFFESAEHPDVFMLQLVENSTNRVFYESYQCNSISDLRCIRNLLYSVSKNPIYLFREVSFSNQSLSSGSSSSALERSVSRTFYDPIAPTTDHSNSLQHTRSRENLHHPPSRDNMHLALSRDNMHHPPSRDSLHHAPSRDSLHHAPSRDNLHHPPYIIPIRRTTNKESPKVTRQVHTHPGYQGHASRSRQRGRSPGAYRAVSTSHLKHEPAENRSPGLYRTSVYAEQLVPVTYHRTRSVYVPVTLQAVSNIQRSDPNRRSGRKEPLIIYAPR